MKKRPEIFLVLLGLVIILAGLFYVYIQRGICRHCMKMKKMAESTEYSLEVFRGFPGNMTRVEANMYWGYPNKEEGPQDVHILPDGSDIKVVWKNDQVVHMTHNDNPLSSRKE